MKIKRSKLIAIIIGSVLGLGLIVGGFLLMQNFTRASSDKPLEVNQLEITSTSAKKLPVDKLCKGKELTI